MRRRADEALRAQHEQAQGSNSSSSARRRRHACKHAGPSFLPLCAVVCVRAPRPTTDNSPEQQDHDDKNQADRHEACKEAGADAVLIVLLHDGLLHLVDAFERLQAPVREWLSCACTTAGAGCSRARRCAIPHMCCFSRAWQHATCRPKRSSACVLQWPTHVCVAWAAYLPAWLAWCMCPIRPEAAASLQAPAQATTQQAWSDRDDGAVEAKRALR